MKTERLLGDPVFQLNLLLWMAKEQPSNGYRVRPLFAELGFKLIYVEQPFRFPDADVLAMEASGLDIKTAPEPELILGRERDGAALYFEAKKDSFGIKSSNCTQARGHLLATGPAFAEVLAPLKECLLCYVVPGPKSQPMGECLGALSEELRANSFRPGHFSVHEISRTSNAITYSWDKPFKAHVGADGESASIMEDVDDETDPSPLILVYTDEDSYNPKMTWLYRRAMIEQVRACLLCSLHNWEVGHPYEVSLDELLVTTTDRVFSHLGRQRQKSLIRLVREMLLRKIVEHWLEKQPEMVHLADDVLTVNWMVTSQKEEFLDWLGDRRTRFEGDKPSEPEKTLFDQEPDD